METVDALPTNESGAGVATLHDQALRGVGFDLIESFTFRERTEP
jgi:hypothetical protein